VLLRVNLLAAPALVSALARSLVCALLCWCGPTAVTGLVVSVHVGAVDGMSAAGSAPHVGEERLVRVSPPFADSDAAPSVKRPVLAGWIFATADDVRPAHVLGGARSAHAFSVLCALLSDGFKPQTATGLLPMAQIPVGDNGATSAVAFAVPPSIHGAAWRPSGLCPAHHYEASMAPSRQVAQSHGPILARWSVVRGPMKALEGSIT
jgi:hypothetical protein